MKQGTLFYDRESGKYNQFHLSNENCGDSDNIVSVDMKACGQIQALVNLVKEFRVVSMHIIYELLKA